MVKKFLFFFIILVIVLIGLGVWVGMLVFGNRSAQSNVNASPYSAVYLSTGDIYFGKLSWSPSPHLDSVWYLQKGNAPTGAAQYGIAPFASAFWGPVDQIYFSQEQIIFWTPLKADSVVARALANPALFEQLLQQTNQPSSSVPVPATSTNGKK